MTVSNRNPSIGVLPPILVGAPVVILPPVGASVTLPPGAIEGAVVILPAPLDVGAVVPGTVGDGADVIPVVGPAVVTLGEGAAVIGPPPPDVGAAVITRGGVVGLPVVLGAGVPGIIVVSLCAKTFLSSTGS